MRQKGFTLVEMLGVMALLAVIFAVLSPNIMHLLENGKNDDYAEYEQNIYLATEAYVNSNNDLSASLSEGNSVEVTYLDLIKSGYLSSRVANPKTGVLVSEDAELGKKVIVTIGPDRTYKYNIE